MLNRLLLVLDVVLVATAGGLGVQLHRIWTETPTVAAAPAAPAPAAAADSAPAAPAAPKPASASPSAFTVIAERNLFTPTRTELGPEPPKPPVTATGTPVPPVRPAEKPRLYGVVMGADGGSRAYLWDPQTKKVFGYKVGDSVADSQVEKINADRVTMRRGAEVFEVLLRDPSKPRPTPPPAAPQIPQIPRPPIAGAPGVPEAAPPFVFPGQPVVPGQPPVAGPGVTAPTVPPQRTLPFSPGRPQLRVPPGTPGVPNVPAQPPTSGDTGS